VYSGHLGDPDAFIGVSGRIGELPSERKRPPTSLPAPANCLMDGAAEGHKALHLLVAVDEVDVRRCEGNAAAGNSLSAETCDFWTARSLGQLDEPLHPALRCSDRDIEGREVTQEDGGETGSDAHGTLDGFVRAVSYAAGRAYHSGGEADAVADGVETVPDAGLESATHEITRLYGRAGAVSRRMNEVVTPVRRGDDAVKSNLQPGD
jgi:hypothetical protein